MSIRRIWTTLSRCKQMETSPDDKMDRTMTLFDLTALGVGSTLGLGVYVLAGAVAKSAAGPAVCISFFIAAIASVFAGLCFAEFAARVPGAGSAYVYSYVSVGEFIAFTIGWNLMLEYVIGAASVAKGLANYLDSLTNNTIQQHMVQAMPINVSFFGSYPDFLALLLVLIMTTLLAIGARESSLMNNILTSLNLTTICVVITAGAIKSDVSNWRIDPANVPDEYKESVGSGGFFPYGFAGIMAGAARCFFGFIGFDTVSAASGEARNPQKHIPWAIIISLTVVFLAYFGISSVVTLMWPYYLQDENAPLPYVFTQVDLPVVKWFVTVGAIFAMCTSLLGAMFPMPRVFYAMGVDGLLFRPTTYVSPRTRTPLVSTLVAGALTGLMASFFNLAQLIDLNSIGTLLAYSIVAVSVLVLRYKENESPIAQCSEFPKGNNLWFIFRQIFNLNNIKEPSNYTSNIAKIAIGASFFLTLIVCALVVWTEGPASFVFLVLFLMLLLVSLVVMCRQPRQDVSELSFKVPLVPLIPYLSIGMNLYLTVQIQGIIWLQYTICMIVGYLIYFFYGISHSVLIAGPVKAL